MPYAEPPWIFKGRALYQLQLVKESEARKHTPAELPLVSFLGYTLGGFYLARYSDSPVGAFDELVVISGLVWNVPTSCAWAARVYVNNSDARKHGRKDVGLPSRLASFSEDSSQQPSWWHAPQPDTSKLAQQAALSKQPGQRHTQAPAALDTTTTTTSSISSSSSSNSSSISSSRKGVTIRNVERRHWAQPWRRNTEQLQEPVCN